MKGFLDVEKQEQKLKFLIEDFPWEDKKLINEALELAKEKHAGQKRDEGRPYVIHCLRVACSLIEETGIKNSEVICAAILHDTIEDTDLDLKEITQKFGKRVGEIVSALTRVKREDETKQNKYERKYQHFLKIMESNKQIRTIKTCDYLDNVRSWPLIPENHLLVKKLSRWFKEGENMYLPLAESCCPAIARKMRKALDVAKTKWKDYVKENT